MISLKNKLINIGSEERLKFPKMDLRYVTDEIRGFEKGIMWYQQEIKKLFKKTI